MKQKYCAGEEIKVKIDIDNSKVPKPIEILEMELTTEVRQV
jgi:hypothetical protein